MVMQAVCRKQQQQNISSKSRILRNSPRQSPDKSPLENCSFPWTGAGNSSTCARASGCGSMDMTGWVAS